MFGQPLCETVAYRAEIQALGLPGNVRNITLQLLASIGNSWGNHKGRRSTAAFASDPAALFLPLRGTPESVLPGT